MFALGLLGRFEFGVILLGQLIQQRSVIVFFERSFRDIALLVKLPLEFTNLSNGFVGEQDGVDHFVFGNLPSETLDHGNGVFTA